MAVIETPRQQYYNHSRHTATYYALYVSLEKWLASSIFKNDLSRVFLSSTEYAYRRRFELTDPSEAYDTVSASSLQFPFANYWPLNTGWRPDTRIAAPNAAMIESGIYTQHGKLRAMPVITTIVLVAHFDREDDARIAYERLLWMSFRERYFATAVAWHGESLGLPMNIKIQNLAFNPRYREKDWLETNRIFTVEASIDLRSYAITANVGEAAYDDSSFDDDSNNPFYYLTEEARLEFVTAKSLSSDIVVQGVFDYNPEIAVNQLSVISKTSTTATLMWSVTADPLHSITITLSNGSVISVDPQANTFRLDQLTGGSDYTATVTFMTEHGVSKSIAVPFTTEPSLTGSVADESLVGTIW